MQEIRDWLNSTKEYATGVKLYLKFGSDPILKSLFTKEAESQFKRERLFLALKSIYDNYRKPTTAKAAIQRQVEKQRPPENFKYWPTVPISDPVLSALHEQWKPIYAEMMNLSARLHEVAVLGGKDQQKALEACSMAHRVLDLDDQCDEIYAKRDHYYQHGTLPGPLNKPEPVGDPVRWVTLMNNAERYVRQYKNKLKRDPANEKIASQLQKHQEAYSNYRKLLKLD